MSTSSSMNELNLARLRRELRRAGGDVSNCKWKRFNEDSLYRISSTYSLRGGHLLEAVVQEQLCGGYHVHLLHLLLLLLIILFIIGDFYNFTFAWSTTHNG